MRTSRRNWSSGSAAQADPTGCEVKDAPTAPAQPSAAAQASPGAASFRSQLRPGSMAEAFLTPLLAQHRLGFGDHVGAVVESLDILDGHRARGAAFEGLVERNGDLARRHFLVHRDGLLDGDRVLDAGLEHADLAE